MNLSRDEERLIRLYRLLSPHQRHEMMILAGTRASDNFCIWAVKEKATEMEAELDEQLDERLTSQRPSRTFLSGFRDWDLHFEPTGPDAIEMVFGIQESLRDDADHVAYLFETAQEDFREIEFGRDEMEPDEWQQFVQQECQMHVKAWQENVLSALERRIRIPK